MANAGSTSKFQCYVALGPQIDDEPLVQAIRKSVADAKFQLIQPLVTTKFHARWHKSVAESIAKADCIIADVTRANPYVFFEIGYAEAFDKSIFLISRDAPKEMFEVIRDYPILKYEPADLKVFRNALTNLLVDYKDFPRRSRMPGAARSRGLFAVDWERLNQEDVENLCLELLTQLGYRRVDWETEIKEIDLVAELPKKDPDGFEYRELWLVSMGRRAPPGMLLEMLEMLRFEPEYFFRRLTRSRYQPESTIDGYRGTPITILFILPKESTVQEEILHLESRLRKRGGPINLRLRIWDRNYLTSLVYQFPQIGFKYFSDEGRSRSKYRKTPEELYRETVELNQRLTTTLAALRDETDKRIRAERDAVWKDISLSAAHKIGNPIFAIETNLDPLQKRVVEGRTSDAVTVVKAIRSSIEKAKGIIEQFTSLTKAQELSLGSVKLLPLIEESCDIADANLVRCEIKCPPDVALYADVDRIGEVFDELMRNALNWLDKDSKLITIKAKVKDVESLPAAADPNLDYAIVSFADNGVGVPLENKSKIFDAFFTTHQHGTGLGLALVRRIVEAHRGAILEQGVPGEGADFQIYLPLFTERNLAHFASKKEVTAPAVEVA
jgi:signal transduction histidine kinase